MTCSTVRGSHTSPSASLYVNVCQAIVDEHLDKMMTTPTTEAGFADDWYQRWNFPHTLGAFDEKHVACKAPPNTSADYYNYKCFFSVLLSAMVSSDYKFKWMDVIGNDSASDPQVYNHSELKAGLEANAIVGWPRSDPLPNNTQDAPYFIHISPSEPTSL